MRGMETCGGSVVTANGRRNLVVVAVLTVIGGAPWLIAYLARDVPTAQQACTKKCASFNKDGVLIYRGPLTPKDFGKDARSDCECREPNQ